MENLDPQARPATIESTPPEINSYLPLKANVTADLLQNAACPHCGRRGNAAPVIAPFGLLISLSRFVIAIGAAISVIAIIISVFRLGMYRFVPGELWALFATFVLSTGVLLLYEIRDLLRQRVALPPPGSVTLNGPDLRRQGLTWAWLAWAASLAMWLSGTISGIVPAYGIIFLLALEAGSEHRLNESSSEDA